MVEPCMAMGIVGFAASIILSNPTSALMMLGLIELIQESVHGIFIALNALCRGHRGG